MIINLNPTAIDIIVNLYSFFNDEKKVVAWLTVKNPHFGNIAPLNLINRGKEEKVQQFIDNALWENEVPLLELINPQPTKGEK